MRASILAFAVATLSSGCGGDDAPIEDAGQDAPIDSGRPEGTIPFEATRVLEPSELAGLVRVEDDSLAFDASAFATDPPTAGDVILGGASEMAKSGVLRRVVSVENAEGELRLTTLPATVFHAYRRANVSFRARLTANAPTYPSSALVSPEVEAPREGNAGGTVPFELDTDGDEETPEDVLAGDVTMTGEVSVRFELFFDWGNTTALEATRAIGDGDGPYLGVNEEVATRLRLLVVYVTYTDFRTAFDLDATRLAQADLDGPGAEVLRDAFVANGMTFVPRFTVRTHVTSEGGGRFSLAAQRTASIDLGVGYDQVTGGSVYRSGPSVNRLETTREAAIGAGATRLETSLDADLTLFGGAFARSTILAQSDVDVDEAREPCFVATADLDATLQMSGLGGEPFEVAMPILSEDLVSGACAE